MQKNKILTKKILYIFFIIIIPLILGTNFVKKYNISSDHNQRLAMALNYKLSGRISLSTNLSKSNEEYSILRSPLYSIIVSLVIPKITFENIKSYECYQKSQTEECYSVLRNIQIFNLATFVSIILMTFFLANKFLKEKISFLCSIFLSLNSYLLTNITLVSPELLSTLIFLIIIIIFIKFIEKKKNYLLYFLGFVFSLLILLKTVFLLLPLLIFIFLIYKKEKISYLIIFIILSYSGYFFWMYNNNIILKNNNYSKNLIEDDSFFSKKYKITHPLAHSVTKQRAVYNTISYSDIFPLMISFVPEYGNIILHKYFSSKKYEKFATIYNGRSYFYRNNVSIFNESFDQIYKEDQNFSFLKKSVVLSIYHLDKQIILTPIFIFRSIFLGGNTEMIKDLFPEKNNFYLFLPLFTKIINPLFGLIFFISFFIINKKTFNINHKITLLFIFYVVLAYASFSHFLPRYSVIYLPLVYIFVFNFLISLKPR